MDVTPDRTNILGLQIILDHRLWILFAKILKSPVHTGGIKIDHIVFRSFHEKRLILPLPLSVLIKVHLPNCLEPRCYA